MAAKDAYRDIPLNKGRANAKARGIVGYRVISLGRGSGKKLRIAIVRKKGPRGGRTVAVTKLVPNR
jgi:hypothetical protein